MAQIFISYRRADTGKDAGRIYDRLVTEFGANNIFKDVYNIPAGSDFRGELAKALSTCRVVLVLIGTKWLKATDPQGQRRLDDIDDFVRLEVQTALERETCIVIPLLLDDARMPNQQDLPPDLRELVFRNALPVRDDPSFNEDITALIERITTIIYPTSRESMPTKTERPRRKPIAQLWLNAGFRNNNLWFLKRKLQSQQVKLTNTSRVIFGRDPELVNFQIEYPHGTQTVSRVHCVLQYWKKYNAYFLLDTESSNGTFLNGERIPSYEATELYSGDEITLSEPAHGGISFTFLSDITVSEDAPIRRRLILKHNRKPQGTGRLPSDPVASYNQREETTADIKDLREQLGWNNLQRNTSDEQLGNTVQISHDVFVSFSLQDSDKVKKIAQYLSERHGVKCWWESGAGAKNSEEKKDIRIAIERSKCIIVALSKTSSEAGHVKAELSYAAMHDKEIIPIRLDRRINIPTEIASRPIDLYEDAATRSLPQDEREQVFAEQLMKLDEVAKKIRRR